MARTLFTVGHSTRSVDAMRDLLRKHRITAVADVRSHPYSRINPQFNREPFSRLLKEMGLSYFFMGTELGARSEDPECYVSGKVQYDLLARTAHFQAGLEHVLTSMRNHHLALMCAEKDPLACHRSILVARHLVGRGARVEHIWELGRTESHDEALTRLISELGLPEQDLFRTRNDLIDQAYLTRGRQIAFRGPGQARGELLRA